MIHRKLLMATAIIACRHRTACSDTTAPKPLRTGRCVVRAKRDSPVTKECSTLPRPGR